MEEKDRKALKDNLYILSENCNFDNIVMFLKERKVFTGKQIQQYESENFKLKGEDVKCQQLFTDIQTRGPDAFGILLECLRQTGHTSQFNILLGQIRGRVTDLPREDILRVRKSKSFPSRPDVYKMTSYPKGYYIFLNNINFQRSNRRNGAENDKEFTDILDDMGYHGFGDGYYLDQTKEQMRKLLQDFAKHDALAKADSCVVAISTHGIVANSRTIILGTNDYDESNLLLSDEIISIFNSKDCKLRPGCPKIFIINACRGDCEIYNNYQYGDLVHIEQSHHEWQDTFFLAPCVEGFKANRHPNDGSWLYLALKEVFKNHAHNRDLRFMINLVNDKFDEYCEVTGYQQTLSYNEYEVNKKLYFNPGLYERGD